MADEASNIEISPETRPLRSDGWSVEAFERGHVLFDPGTERVVELNGTASLIWHLCDGTRTAAEITELIVEAFPDARPRVVADVGATFERLRSVGCIVVA